MSSIDSGSFSLRDLLPDFESAYDAGASVIGSVSDIASDVGNGFMSLVADTTGLDKAVGTWFGDVVTSFKDWKPIEANGADQYGYNPNASPSSGGPMTTEQATGTSGGGFFDTLVSAVKKDFGANPRDYLKAGLDTVGGMYAANEKRNAVEAQQQGYLNQQNNADALKQAEIQRYNASFKSRPRVNAPSVQAPLTRTDGTPVYDANGNLKGVK